MVFVFDALSNGCQAEADSQARDCGCNLMALSSFTHGANEALVDLDFVQRQRIQVTKTGVSRTEVIRRQPYSMCLELLGNGESYFQIIEQGGLGNLNDQLIQRKSSMLSD